MADDAFAGWNQGLMRATSEGVSIEAKSSNDIIIEIAGIFFPLKALNYTKTIEVTDEYGTGLHGPYDLNSKQIAISGNFSYGSFITKGERDVLRSLLEDQGDEGLPLWFQIIVMDRATGGGSKGIGSYIEALMNCKITSSGRDYNENGTVLTRQDFKSMGRVPK